MTLLMTYPDRISPGGARMNSRSVLESLIDELPTLTESEKWVLRTVMALTADRTVHKPVEVPPLPTLRPVGAITPERLQRLRQQPYGLTQREVDVVGLLVDGLRNKEAGRVLGISPRTVETHRQRVMEKLGATSALQLGQIVLRVTAPA